MPPKKEGLPRYLACNGDESEPGTCKDRRIFEYNPHLFIEGAIIACYAMEMDAAYVYIRGEYIDWIDMMQEAVDQAYAKGYVGENIMGSGKTIHMYVHRGAGAYICGEETSLMESLEGKRPYPRSKPPFPAQYGLWGKPTTINNIETLAHVPLVIKHGAAWWSSIGAKTHPGPFLYGISGHVNRPGVYEYPSGMLLTDLIYNVAGGIRGGKKLKAVVPGGSSVPILRADQLEGITMDADSLRTVGTFVGTAGICVLDEDTDIVKFLIRVSKFYDHESCGQCTPCREGTGWFVRFLKGLMQGRER
jgi:NADH-quinone oxidoreductase subunit F